jgi:GH15 family glucan-1,4-alpha-glucosidase
MEERAVALDATVGESQFRAEADSATEHTPYPAIGNYALIGDTRSAALISNEGAVEWLCWPNFASTSVFAAVLDRRRGGHFRITPTVRFATERAYLGNTNILETRFISATGITKVVDCTPFYERAGQRVLEPQRELLRIVECLEGTSELDVEYAPRPDYGRATPRLRQRGKLGWACESGGELFLLHTDAPLAMMNDQDLRGRLRLRAGDRLYFSLTYTRCDVGVVVPIGEEADARVEKTKRWWQRWSSQLTYRDPYHDAVLRSALVLKLLSHTETGAIVAAPTASLPEIVGGQDNWDYRYCWLRDAAITLRAFMGLGFIAEGDAFFEWLLHATRLTWPKLQVLYDVYGEARVPETVLEHFEGYRGSAPVRIGNNAWNQSQLDVYGELLLAAHEFVRQGGMLDQSERRILRGLGRTVCRQWHFPDHGIWEVRGPPQQRTFSKLMCWAALDRLLLLAHDGVLHLRRTEATRLRYERDAIREDIELKAYHTGINSYVGAYDSEEIDASLLLIPRIHYQDANHPRMQATFETIQRVLGRGEALLRRVGSYQSSKAPREGCFGIASFWAVDYLARCGRCKEARQRFEILLGYANDLGLYGEEIEPNTGAVIGNFPQAFTHAGLIVAALALEQFCPAKEKEH